MAVLTAAEMRYESRLIFESIVSGDAPGFTAREWSELLTQAQEFEIRSIIKNGLDNNEINRKSLDRLIIDNKIVTGANVTAGHLPNSYRVDVPVDYYHILNKYANLAKATVDYNTIKVVPISHQAYKSNINNPTKKPYVDSNNNEGLVWELVYNKSSATAVRQILVIVPSGYTLEDVVFDYIKNPKPIIVPFTYTSGTIEGLDLTNATQQAGINCELSSIVQREIVKRAADLAAAYARDKLGYQLQKTEGNEPQQK